MATQTVTAAAVPNRTLSAALYSQAMALVATASSVSEALALSGVYQITFSEAAALSGSYRLVIVDDLTGYGVASYSVTLTGVDETVDASEFTQEQSTDQLDEKLDQILTKVTPLTTVFVSQPDSSTLSLIQGDDYDGVSWPKLVFDVGKDLSGVTEVSFTVSTHTEVLFDHTNAGVSAAVAGQTVEVTILNEASALLPVGEALFELELISTDSHQTVFSGVVETCKDLSP